MLVGEAEVQAMRGAEVVIDAEIPLIENDGGLALIRETGGIETVAHQVGIRQRQGGDDLTHDTRGIPGKPVGVPPEEAGRLESVGSSRRPYRVTVGVDRRNGGQRVPITHTRKVSIDAGPRR